MTNGAKGEKPSMYWGLVSRGQGSESTGHGGALGKKRSLGRAGSSDRKK